MKELLFFEIKGNPARYKYANIAIIFSQQFTEAEVRVSVH